MTSKKTRTAPGPQSRNSAGRQRDNAGRFLKGASGNPGGTKHLSPEMKEFARDRSLKGLKKLDAMLDRETTQDKDVIAVVRLFLEYGYGRPAAEFDRERLDIDVRRLAMDERKAESESNENAKIEVIISNQAKEWGE